MRPKPSSHLTGRGAQLINMIRNKKVDISAAATATSSPSNYPTSSVSTPFQQRNPAAELMELTGTNQTSTPVQHKDFLVFSKREDLSFDSPAFKRERVSFHDPPVSVTKVYLRDADETKTKPKRYV